MAGHEERNGAPGRPGVFTTDIPARLDRLPWGRFHWLLVIALGVTWVLDGLEGTIVAAINPVLTRPATLGLRDTQVGLAVGTAIGGLLAPALFGGLIETGRRELLVFGYWGGAGLMLAAAAVELWLGVASERKALEDVAAPLTAEWPAALSRSAGETALR
jgi:hypothetical protein